MVRLLKNIDAWLIKNKPDTWFSRIHYFLPFAFLVVVIAISSGFLLPLTSNTIPLLIAGCFIFLCLYIYLIRIQFMYSTENFNTKQLHKIFLLNLLTITFFVLIAVIAPCILASRINYVTEKNDFNDDTQKIRIAMIKAGHIDFLKDSTLYYYTDAEDLPDELRKIYYDIKTNEFIKNDITNLRLSSSGRKKSIAEADTTAFRTDSAAIKRDTISGPGLADTSGIRNRFSGQPKKGNLAIQLEQDHPFIEMLKNMSLAEVHKIKDTIGHILNRYDFTVYNKADTVTADVNKYFKILNKESVNLYKSKKMYYDPVVMILFLCLVTIILSQLSLLILLKRQTVIAILSFASFLTFCLISVLLPDVLANPIVATLVCIFALLFFILVIFSKKLFKKKFYDFFDLGSLFFLYFFQHLFVLTIIIFLAVFYINFINTDSYILEHLESLSLKFMFLYIALFLVVNYQFIKGYQIAIKKPKK